jgi:hypothetical protein
MNKVFIFSTRYSCLSHKNDTDYLFSKGNCDTEQYSFDTNFLHEPTDSEIVKWVLELPSEEKEKYRDDFLKTLKGSPDTKKYIWNIKMGEKKELSEEEERFSKLSKEEENHLIRLAKSDYGSLHRETKKYCKIKDKNIYAVEPHDKSDECKKWIECLLNLNEFVISSNEVYLILHDKDIYAKGEPFKVLSPTEIKKYTTTNKNIKILVFNHDEKSVTDILRSNDLSDIDIENKIESIFYKYPLKKMLVEYIDIKSGANTEDKKEISYQEIKEYLANNQEQLKVNESDIAFLENINVQERTDIDRFKDLIKRL